MFLKLFKTLYTLVSFIDTLRISTCNTLNKNKDLALSNELLSPSLPYIYLFFAINTMQNEKAF